MRVLLAAVLGLAVLWGGYWFVGARAVEHQVAQWFDSQAAAGFVATREDAAVHGFPSRFDLTIDAPVLADPQRGFGWQAPFVQILSLSYKPWHLIGVFPPEQTFITPGETVSLTADRLRGSVVFDPTASFALDRSTLIGDGLFARSDAGWQVGAANLRFGSRPVIGRANTHDLGLAMEGIALDPGFMESMGSAAGLPETVQALRLDAEIGLTAALDRHAPQTKPKVENVTVNEVLVTWGELELSGKGKLVVDANGIADGAINLRLENWRMALPPAIAAGLISAEVAPTWERALALLADQAGTPDRLDLPLTFRRGWLSLGPLPLGPAPVFN
jgi:hypothetical protein